jgi:hypothetical protein
MPAAGCFRNHMSKGWAPVTLVVPTAPREGELAQSPCSVMDVEICSRARISVTPTRDHVENWLARLERLSPPELRLDGHAKKGSWH